MSAPHLQLFAGQGPFDCPSGPVRATLYFFGAIESFAALATRNFTTVFALI